MLRILSVLSVLVVGALRFDAGLLVLRIWFCCLIRAARACTCVPSLVFCVCGLPGWFGWGFWWFGRAGSCGCCLPGGFRLVFRFDLWV